MKALHSLSIAELKKLASAFRSKRLTMPVSVSGLNACFLTEPEVILNDLGILYSQGFTETQAAFFIDSLINERAKVKPLDELVDVVASGPDLPGIMNRDTSVVVQQLFRDAKESVLVVGYSVYQGKRVFASLAEEMTRKPLLDVVMCLNVGRDTGDSRSDFEVRRRYIDQFKKNQWPEGHPLPKLYFDPRAIDADPSKRASLHAKCVVVDSRYSFISSANFTERGQKKNIELGVRIESEHIAESIRNYMFNLIDEKVLEKLH